MNHGRNKRSSLEIFFDKKKLASILADIDKALRCSYEAKNKTLEMCSFA
jgi:hypothetical protein